MTPRLRRLDNEDGFTLVELMVAMGVGVAAISMVGAGVVVGLKAQRKSDAEITGQQVVRQAVNRVTKDLREATDDGTSPAALQTATATSVTFTRQGDYVPPPTSADDASYTATYQITYSVMNTVGTGACASADRSPCLVMRRTLGSVSATTGITTYPTANTVTTVLLSPISTAKPLFTYLACGDALSGTSTVADSTGAVTGDALAHVYAVEVSLAAANYDNTTSRVTDRAVLAVPPTDPYAATPEPC